MLKIGLAIPEQLIGFDPVVLREYAQTAEEAGFDYVTCVDHVLGTTHDRRDPPFPPGGIYTELSLFHEPLTLFSYLAAATSRIEMVTAVLVLPQRQTALVAKQAAEIALLSGHRLVLGVGSGWNHVEYESLGTDYRTRGRRLEEQVVLLRRLWAEPLLDVETPFHRIDRASINPRLDRPVPIWFGGFSDVQQDRCARIGDGMIWTLNTSLSRKGIDTIRQRADESGRDPDSIGFQATITPREGQSLQDALHSWRSAGGTHATLSIAGTGMQGAELVGEIPRLRQEAGDFIAGS
jgi:probable F420-dependent oxidoreductase